MSRSPARRKAPQQEQHVQKNLDQPNGGAHTHWVDFHDDRDLTTNDGHHAHVFIVNGKLVMTEYDGVHHHKVENGRVLDALDTHQHVIKLGDDYAMTEADGTAHNHGRVITADHGWKYVEQSGEHRHELELLDGSKVLSLLSTDILSVEFMKRAKLDIHEVLFWKERFLTFEKAAKWCDEHDFETRKTEERTQFFAFEQAPRASFDEATLKTVELMDGVCVVIGILKENVGGSEPEEEDDDDEEVDASDALAALLTSGHEVLTEEQADRLADLRDEFAAQVAGLAAAVAVALPLVSDFVQAMTQKVADQDALALFDRLDTNLGTLHDELAKTPLAYKGALEVGTFEESLRKVKEALGPVIEIFDGTSFDHLNLLLKASALTVDAALARRPVAVTKQAVTDFPEKGGTEKVSLTKSRFGLFPVEYAEDIRKNFPELWSAAGNLRGNEAFEKLPLAKRATATPEQETWIRMRERWAERHFEDESVAGVIAQMKWSVVGKRGVDGMKALLDGEKRKVIAKRRDELAKALEPKDGMTQEELRHAQEARSEHFGVEVLKGAPLSFPEGFPASLADYADPVNFRFPVDSVEKARKARARFKQFVKKTYTQDTSRAAVHERIVRKAIDLGITVALSESDPLDKLLPRDLFESQNVTVVKGAVEGEQSFELFVPIHKAAEERIAFGIVMEPDIVDLHGDTYSEAEVRKAAHTFMQDFGNTGVMHKFIVNDEVKILESYIAPIDMELSDSDGNVVKIKKGTWLMTVRVLDDTLWKSVKTGDFTGFSIGGVATVQTLEDDAA